MGISLHDRAVSDSQKIHNNNLGGGGFSVDVKFTNREDTPESQTILALYNDTGLQVDPETGFVVSGSKFVLSFHQSDLTLWDGKEDITMWKVELTNGAGQDIVAKIDNVYPNRSFGEGLISCKIISGHRNPTT